MTSIRYVLQCVAVCCSVLQCVAVCCNCVCAELGAELEAEHDKYQVRVAVCCRVLQCVAVCGSL